MKTSVEIRANIDEKLSRLDELEQLATSEDRDLTEDEQTEWDAAMDEVKTLKERLVKVEGQEELRKELASRKAKPVMPVNTEVQKESKEDRDLSEKFDYNLALRKFVSGKLDGAEREMHEKGVESFAKCNIPVGRNALAIPASELRAGITENSTTGIAKMGIEASLKANTILTDLGVTRFTGVEDVRIPLLGAVNTAWEGETDAAADAGTAMSKVDLSPTRLSGYIDYSIQANMQHNNTLSSALYNDILAQVASDVEQAVFTTTSGAPTYIGSGKTAVTATDITDLLMAIEEEVMGNNAYRGNLGFAASHSLYAEIATAAQVGSVNTLLSGMIVNGHPIRFSSQIADIATNQESVYFGNWADLAIAQFGGILITDDQVTQVASGNFRLVLNTFWDFALKRGASISVGGFTGTNK